MAFELTLVASNTTGDGANLIITDGSDWAQADFPRTAFGVHVKGEFRILEAPTEVVIATYDPLDAVQWTAATPQNGRYSFTAYAFVEKDTEVPAEGDVHIDITDGLLYQWVSAAWVLITLDAAITAGKAYYTSPVLDVPFLAYAYAYKNVLNLKYIKQVKNDISKGTQQNKMYYNRTDLDYFSSIILGAEYNWAIGLYSNYYELVNNINSIISSGIIS
jgi:hypothetical protein